MKTIIILSAAALAIVAPAAQALAAAAPYLGYELASRAKVQLAQAEAIAAKARPGRIIDRELEKEAGGSGLRWSFNVSSRGKAFEVGVDAQTGKVLENRVEGAHPD
ncbi:PepSY domain-containing protein [Phenylobacterium sp.]|jgi:uncharacterized membrane protein YkoI|uniref:PepSY domain-containing protein n=1 Tax=Phenylobacterium sp. TaxID=1871053 RepID=UPI002E32291F|nr:PepSY domain-containing protein [Phenylobacterium sp.]HEX3365311.1 PepSY domain-containing protein [Phenylobacterium sp.]